MNEDKILEFAHAFMDIFPGLDLIDAIVYVKTKKVVGAA